MKASKYFIVGLSCLYKFNLKSLVQTALTTLAMITLTSLVITALIYISVGNAKAKPTSKPTIQQTQRPQNHTSPLFTEHNYKSTHTSIQSTTLSQLLNIDTTRGTTYSHPTDETQNRKIKSQSTLPATRQPPINPSGSNPPKTTKTTTTPKHSPMCLAVHVKVILLAHHSAKSGWREHQAEPHNHPQKGSKTQNHQKTNQDNNPPQNQP